MPLFRRKQSSRSPAPAAPSSTPAQGAHPHLLVCDDNESVTQLVELMFANESWTVETVRSGRECLSALEQRPADVVLLDQQMDGGLSGLETAAVARKGGFDRPILLFSAHLDDQARKRAAQLDVLPVNKVDFPAVVRHVDAAHRAYRRRARAARRSVGSSS